MTGAGRRADERIESPRGRRRHPDLGRLDHLGTRSDPPNGQRPLSASERSAAFTTGRVPVDRAAALRAGSVPVPRRFVLWLIVGFAVLGIGGIIAEKLIGNAGVGALISTPVTTLAGTAARPRSPPPSRTPRPVHAAPSAVIGLDPSRRQAGPAGVPREPERADLDPRRRQGQGGRADLRRRRLRRHLPGARPRRSTRPTQQLGARSADVDFVVVNSDPLETSLAPTPPALTETGLAGHSNVTFLNGSLSALGGVWKRYGVTVAVNTTDRVITHTDVMDFIDPTGQLVLRASPFANENTLGIYSLQPGVIHTFATGVADSAAGLLKGAS